MKKVSTEKQNISPEHLQDALRVLDYWYTTGMLEQDSLVDLTDWVKTQQKIQDYKAKLARYGASAEQKRAADFLWLSGDSLYEQIRNESDALHMKTWGEIALYGGRVRREACIRSLLRELGIADDEAKRPEKSNEEIPLICLRLNEKGQYVKNSFSISPDLWAVKALKESGKKDISEALTADAYQSSVKEIEEKYFPGEDQETGAEKAVQQIAHEKIAGAGKATQDSREETAESPVFSEDAVSVRKIADLLQYIKKNYIAGSIEIADTDQWKLDICGAQLRYFRGKKEKEAAEEEDYTGLSHDFFSRDLKLVRDKMAGSPFEDEAMESALVDYINAPNEPDRLHSQRHDMISPENDVTFKWLLSEILDIRNAPLGKWPSRYMPALMQQVAVNLAIQKSDARHTDGAGKIVSVNGPPGTGKTTLLKEIIANNIVERARLMMEFDDPDQAFEKCSFRYGDRFNNAYDTDYPYWYRMRRQYDALNDYGIVVASTGNKAVENITKELPVAKNIQKDLKIGEGDSEETKRMLRGIAALYGVEEQEDTSGDSAAANDVYFTSYAEKLFADGRPWGMITVPLGKKQNIRDLYFSVLQPLLRENGDPDSRKQKYREEREKFSTCLREVQKAEAQLAVLSSASRRIKAAEDVYLRKKYAAETFEREKIGEIRTLRKEIATLKSSIAYKNDVITRETAAQNEFSRKRRMAQQEAALQSAKAKAWYSASGAKACFLKPWTRSAVRARNAQNLAMAAAAETEKRRCEEAAKQYAAYEKEACARCNVAGRSVTEEKRQLEKADWNLKCIGREIQEKKNEAADAEQQVRMEQRRYAQQINEMKKRPAADQCLVFDTVYVKKILYGDEKASTDAQVGNPWFTERYNRMREKLFYEALQLNREFVLSSKCCIDNLHILARYWGLESYQKRIIYQEKDRTAMAPSLFQTLLLAFPVISTTFASVGTMFRDVQEAGSLGTLVVDEAGQASPQAAVGAIFRSRRAVIVGDSKQIEPVVKDDLELLKKKAFKDRFYGAYKEKTLSVQNCADLINPFGAYLSDTYGHRKWIGCPLVVHRRCISPMYDIANKISYNGFMKQQTREPSEETAQKFIFNKSQWINVTGNEIGSRNHYVERQGNYICEIVTTAVEEGRDPDLFIISPFKTVVNGLQSAFRQYCDEHKGSRFAKWPYGKNWIAHNIGTVHTFQGKEANEVIFLLGCDRSAGAKGAVAWVNSNIVNVAVTRAKYRLCIVGDVRVWKPNPYVMDAKNVMDVLPIEELDRLLRSRLPEEKKRPGIEKAVAALPSAESFVVKNENGGGEDYEIEADGLVEALQACGFGNARLKQSQIETFGFHSEEEILAYGKPLSGYLLFGIVLHAMFRALSESEPEMDASFCGILLCKALEFELRKNIIPGLKVSFPDEKYQKKRIAELDDSKFMIGVLKDMLNKPEHKAVMVSLLPQTGDPDKDAAWMEAFIEKFSKCNVSRKLCCHPEPFSWDQEEALIRDAFQETTENEKKIGGIFFESKVARLLERTSIRGTVL